MKKFLVILTLCILTGTACSCCAQASFVSDRGYRIEQRKIEKREIKQIKKLFSLHTNLANEHDIEALKPFYSDSYMNNDGFNKEVYFKNVKETWDECPNLTYKIKISQIQIDGDYANVTIEEQATGTVFENLDLGPAAGEIHSQSKGIYHLTKINDKWLITGETVLSDESSLLYGDARFMNIELIAPSQIPAGEAYTATVKVETDKDTYIIGSITQDPVTYPAINSNPPLRIIPQSQVLERILNANTDNLNEYAVTSLAISKTKNIGFDNYKIYMAGLACVMKRVNVIPKNNFIKIEEKNESINM